MGPRPPGFRLRFNEKALCVIDAGLFLKLHLPYFLPRVEGVLEMSAIQTAFRGICSSCGEMVRAQW